MSKAPQTEEDERAAVIYELGSVSGMIWQLTGKMPVVIRALFDDGAIDFTRMTTEQIADLCAEVRSEWCAVGGVL